MVSSYRINIQSYNKNINYFTTWNLFCCCLCCIPRYGSGSGFPAYKSCTLPDVSLRCWSCNLPHYRYYPHSIHHSLYHCSPNCASEPLLKYTIYRSPDNIKGQPEKSPPHSRKPQKTRNLSVLRTIKYEILKTAGIQWFKHCDNLSKSKLFNIYQYVNKLEAYSFNFSTTFRIRI
jgi:hypothetical protein